MKVLVCIKQVPDMESKFKVASNNVWYEDTDLAYRMNEYDEYAVEQAVRLKEQVGDCDVTVLSIGPERVKEAIKKALAMGCDRGVHINDNDYYSKDPYQKAQMIAEFAKDKNFDIIFTGLQSQDTGSAQVGVLLGELLELPVVTTIVSFEYNDGEVTVKRELEGGKKSIIKVKVPAVFTCQLGLNEPRYPTLPNIMKAKKKEILTFEASELLKAENLVTTAKMAFPEKKGGAQILEGDVAELVDKVVQILKEKSLV
ncbi:electron transfer flavoprotein subunit beta/FixA family protein [Deferribacterales bacterium Es71-Z0220]|uniref:electron transfer flavoprotein subunit beta/FixA family protein n=1 Tax=Deferrivibrio essentukiensis TaxID=2880922 RepID=UPI001F60120A|nr:electron transfer flavoprotein subunit beta/FixA family protein [Deferrivibrio essentukiensis]MCB4204310.1 electron transfer flavoprotein subunit beta/FixA family protein [Deferrivibrio essentukiensis]